MLINHGFALLLASPPQYQGLVAEIYFDGKFVALVSPERGPGQFEVEMPGGDLVDPMIQRRVDSRGFIEASERACQRLSAG